MNPLRALFMGISRMPPAFMLLTIIGLAVGVTFLVTDRLKKQEDDYRTKTDAMTAQMSAKSTVVYSTRDIPEGQTIPSEALEERQIDQAKQPQDAIATSAMAAGRIAKYGIATGQIVSQHDLLPQGISMGFEARLRPGMRAVTFAVDNNSGVAGFVAPESHVDIISMVGAGAETKARPVLSDVEVIAVGQTYQKNPGAAQATPASSVTVAIGPDDAQKLIKAVLASKIYLSLRNNSDHTPVATVDVSSLFAKPPVSNAEVAMTTPLPPMPQPITSGTDISYPTPNPNQSAGAPVLPPYEVEAWSGAKKDVITVPAK
ncbi:MAG: Flp pilus assembly protein CpaB [Candidatus Melainabacteria bacterium]|nr:Flp pilus assembly protein CpaB [Candidatus Melainabacteria bacterium]